MSVTLKIIAGLYRNYTGVRMNYRVARNFCGSLFLRINDFCVFRELIFGIKTDCFLLLGINFCDFFLVHAIEIHIFKEYYGVLY